MIGFENYCGGIVFGFGMLFLGVVVKGVGNWVGDGFDGVVVGSVVVIYMYGLCLVCNLEFVDLLLSKVVGELVLLDLFEVDLLCCEWLFVC